MVTALTGASQVGDFRPARTGPAPAPRGRDSKGYQDDGHYKRRSENQAHEKVWRHGFFLSRIGVSPYQAGSLIIVTGLQVIGPGAVREASANRRRRQFHSKLPVT
jgi:hypothetical protein